MIVRTRRSSSYTVINNKIINDKNLDWKELGLLIYLLSKPDEWEVSVTHLAKQRKTQTNGIYSILKTLRDIGYIRLEKRHTGKTDWVVYEKPNHEKPNEDNPDKEKPNEEKPNEDNPHQDNPIQVSTERAVSTEEKEKEHCPELKDSELEEAKKEVFIELPLNEKNKYHPVKIAEVNQLSEIYPAVDIQQEIRNMLGWLNARPERRKTKTGINKFINAWLAKAQNSGKTGFLNQQSQYQTQRYDRV